MMTFVWQITIPKGRKHRVAHCRGVRHVSHVFIAFRIVDAFETNIVFIHIVDFE
jgi:hypothetical protein